MKRTPILLAMLAAAAIGASACSVESRSELLLPTEPGSTAGTPGPQPSVPSAPAPSGSLGGIWISDGITVPAPGSCNNFQWQVTSSTATSLAGNFSATCGGNVTVTGTASGRIEGNAVPLAVAGTATYLGALSCDFSLTGTGTIVDNDTIVIPYSGSTCLGPVDGTQTLHRPGSAASPAPEPPPPPAPLAPPDPLFGCVVTPERVDMVECIWEHIHPTDNNSAFEVTKRVAWALRGEGAGLLIKNGGENITAWRGYLFSSSRIVYPNGRLVKVIFDAGPGGANGPSWQDAGDFVDPGLYVPAMDPNLP
jgi:hypothetical protein